MLLTRKLLNLTEAWRVCLLGAVLGGCIAYSPSEAPKPTKEVKYSKVRGWVTLQKTDTAREPAFGGITIGLLGSQRTCTSATDGSFVLDSVPEGLYTLTASFPGFDTAFRPGVVALGSLGYLVPSINLKATRNISIEIDSIVWNGGGFANIYFRPFERGELADFNPVIFVGRTRSVSPAWDEHTCMLRQVSQLITGGRLAYLERRFLQTPYIEPGKSSLFSGDSCYVIIYSGEGTKLFADDTLRYRYANLYNPSNVLPFRLP